MPRPGPLGLSARVMLNDVPWSTEVATRIPPLVEPPEAASQARYTLSRKGLRGLVSAAIIGLSVKRISARREPEEVWLGVVLAPPSRRGSRTVVALVVPIVAL